MKNLLLSVHNLHVSINETAILNGINLSIAKGEIHVIMGPNGSGKSTLSKTIVGHPDYKITDGTITFDGKKLQELSVSERAQAGIFLAFQNPLEIEGVSLQDFLYHAYKAQLKNKKKPAEDFEDLLIKNLKLLSISPEFIERSTNFGFSGGEKKRAETLQLALLQPKLAILDEIDSGLDVDALRIVCEGISAVKEENPDMALLIITHYPRILNYLNPDFVHILDKGKIIESGGRDLAEMIEREGYNR